MSKTLMPKLVNPPNLRTSFDRRETEEMESAKSVTRTQRVGKRDAMSYTRAVNLRVLQVVTCDSRNVGLLRKRITATKPAALGSPHITLNCYASCRVNTRSWSCSRLSHTWRLSSQRFPAHRAPLSDPPSSTQCGTTISDPIVMNVLTLPTTRNYTLIYSPKRYGSPLFEGTSPATASFSSLNGHHRSCLCFHLPGAAIGDGSPRLHSLFPYVNFELHCRHCHCLSLPSPFVPTLGFRALSL